MQSGRKIDRVWGYGKHTSLRRGLWSSDGKHLASGGYDGKIQVMSADGEPEWTIVLLPEGRSVTLSAAGEVLHGDPKVIEEELVYPVEKDDGRIEILRPSEFQKRIAAGK